jgi:putative FmdB family regulatory protein
MTCALALSLLWTAAAAYEFLVRSHRQECLVSGWFFRVAEVDPVLGPRIGRAARARADGGARVAGARPVAPGPGPALLAGLATAGMLSGMPIYEYLCAGCSSAFEELVSASDQDAVRCPGCGSGTVTRLLSSFATARPVGASVGGGGGCCGGSCGCGH